MFYRAPDPHKTLEIRCTRMAAGMMHVYLEQPRSSCSTVHILLDAQRDTNQELVCSNTCPICIHLGHVNTIK